VRAIVKETVYEARLVWVNVWREVKTIPVEIMNDVLTKLAMKRKFTIFFT